jgi:hypothetical protein
MTSHMTRAAPKTPPVSGYFLAEATANVSRLIDSMLPTDECAETFVRRGGVALLIRLHAMPFLPDTFSTSSACHALSVTLRSFAGRSPYSPILASQTQDALTQCARLASAAVEDAIRLAVASDPGQPFLDVLDLVVAFRRDPSRVPGAKIEALLHEGLPRDGVANALRDVARALTVTQSVLNLTTSLLRSSPGTMPGLLNELGDGGEGAAAVKEWKPGGLIANVSYVYRNVEILAAILAEKEGERRDARARVANEIPRDAGSEGSDPEPIVAAVAAAMRAVESECARFRASFNAFASSLVKNVANARHRASAETVAFLRVPIAELSACLSVTVGDAADRVGGGPAPFRDGTDTGVLSPGIARRRLCGLFETLHAILIDERRRCSQGLVINYMDRCFGVEHLRRAFESLWSVAADEAGARDKGKEPADKGKEPAGASVVRPGLGPGPGPGPGPASARVLVPVVALARARAVGGGFACAFFVSGACGSRRKRGVSGRKRRARALECSTLSRDVFRFRFVVTVDADEKAGRCGRGGRGVRGRGWGARAGRTFRAPERRRRAAGGAVGVPGAHPRRVGSGSFRLERGMCRLEISTGQTRLHAAAVSP